MRDSNVGYHLVHFNWPEGDFRYSPFSSEFSDMPSQSFPTLEGALKAAEDYVAKYNAMDGGAGGFTEDDNCWWIRVESSGKFRFTRFVIEADN